MLKREREKDAAAHGELQGLLAERSKELSAAKDSSADLELKLVTLTQTLDGTREREAALSEKIKADEVLLANAAAAQDTFRETVEHWTEGLVDAAAPKMSGKLIHEHLWDRRTEPLSVRRGAEIVRRADRGEAHEQFTQLRSSPER